MVYILSKNALAYVLVTILMMARIAVNNAQTPTATPVVNRTTDGPTNDGVSNTTVAPLERVSVTIDSIQITFTGVGTIASSDLLQFQAIMEVWFEAYFNQDVGRRQRYLQLHRRHLQQFRVADVRNMDSSYTVINQDTSTIGGSNAISFLQTLSYDTTSEPRNPQGYALLPYDDSTYKALLLQQLVVSIDSLVELSSISTPIIQPKSIEESDSLSTGGIVGVVLAAGVGLVLMTFVGFLIGKRQLEHPSTLATKNSTVDDETGEHRVGTFKEHQNTTCTEQSPTVTVLNNNPPTIKDHPQDTLIATTNESRWRPDPPTQPNEYKVTYKDQARTVVNPIVVEAIPDANKQSNGSSLIPIASLVAI